MAQVRTLLWPVVNWEQIPELHHLLWCWAQPWLWDGMGWVLCPQLDAVLAPGRAVAPPTPCAMLPSPAAVIYGCDLHSFYWKM